MTTNLQVYREEQIKKHLTEMDNLEGLLARGEISHSKAADRLSRLIRDLRIDLAKQKRGE